MLPARWFARMRRSSSCARAALAFTCPFSRSATPPIRASARLYCVILVRNSRRAASMSASGFASSMPLMNRPRKPRNRRPMRANMCGLLLHETAQRVDLRLELFRRQRAEALGQEARIRALLHRHQVHVFELAGVGARAHFFENVRKDLTNRAPWFLAQLVQS